MHLNEIAEGLEPRDLTQSAEFQSLLQSARDLGIPHSPDVRYVSRQTVVGANRFHFLEWGDTSAPPVLLLHGGNQTAHSWDLVSLHLADRYHVYALDQRGHGDSEWVRDQDYSPQSMASDALGFIAAAGDGVADHHGPLDGRRRDDGPRCARAAAAAGARLRRRRPVDRRDERGRAGDPQLCRGERRVRL